MKKNEKDVWHLLCSVVCMSFLDSFFTNSLQLSRSEQWNSQGVWAVKVMPEIIWSCLVNQL